MKLFFAAAFSLSVFWVTAASAQFNGFPGEIQARIDSGEYVITFGDYLGFGIDSISPRVGAYFFYTDLTQTPAEERVIIRYNIGGDSVYRSAVGGATEETPLTGIAHLDGSREYIGTSFAFKLYLEDMDQGQIFDDLFPHESIRLAYTTAEALLAGEGSYTVCVDDSDDDCYGATFDLASPDQPLICLSEGCQTGATFWLSRIDYVPLPIGFEVDIEPFAFGETEFPPVYEQTQSFPGTDVYDSQSLLQRFELDPVLPGDVNRDGKVDLLDVDRFIELLASVDYRFEADVNPDLNVNLLDVPDFVLLLSQ